MKEKLSASTVAVQVCLRPSWLKAGEMLQFTLFQGSGWGWLGYNKAAGKLQIAACANQVNFYTVLDTIQSQVYYPSTFRTPWRQPLALYLCLALMFGSTLIISRFLHCNCCVLQCHWHMRCLWWMLTFCVLVQECPTWLCESNLWCCQLEGCCCKVSRFIMESKEKFCCHRLAAAQK